MSEDNKIPPPFPADDFDKTTPNIRIPKGDLPANDWDKTNYNFPKQPESGEWGKTQINIKPIDTEGQDFGKTFYPGAKSPTPEWGMTDANINPADFGSRPGDFGSGSQGYDKTTPYFQLPETERAKYQNLPPTPAEKATQEEQEDKAKGGIPAWVWAAAGLMTMFFFAIIIFAVVYLFILRDSSFEVKIAGAPIGSQIQVDGSPMAVSDEDGTFRLKNLKAGRREIKVVHPTKSCTVQFVEGSNGKLVELMAGCTDIKASSTDDCVNFKQGDDDKAERCYNSALDALPDPFTVEDLLKALNILIINFESGKFDIPPVRLAAIQKAATFIKKVPATTVLEVGGHTDNVGNATSNQTLSDARANAVKNTLVKFGVADSMLQTRGYGATKPRPDADNATDTGRYRNRRIEYSLVKK